MANYRYYCLDRQGKISSAEWIEADSDEAALAAAQGLGKTTPCELWLRNRLVCRVEPSLPN